LSENFHILNAPPPHATLLDFSTRKTFGEEYRTWSSTLCSLLNSLVTSFVLGPNIFLSTLFSNRQYENFVPNFLLSAKTHTLFGYRKFLSDQKSVCHFLLISYNFCCSAAIVSSLWLPSHHYYLSPRSIPEIWATSRRMKFGKLPINTGHAVALLVEARRYRPEGLGFDSRWSSRLT
jgi:hypothetical protein